MQSEFIKPKSLCVSIAFMDQVYNQREYNKSNSLSPGDQTKGFNKTVIDGRGTL